MPEHEAPAGQEPAGANAVPLTAEEAEHQRRQTALENIKNDEMGGYAWMLGSIDAVLTLSARFPDYLPIEILSRWVMEYWTSTAANLPLFSENPEGWDRGLRSYVLSKLPELVDQCMRCDLAANRIPKRGSCTGEGSVDPNLMIVGEGPGAFEQRTGIPLTDVISLRVSTCATKCANFWPCWNPNGNQYVRTPFNPCDYTPVPLDADELRKRMASRNQGVQTAGTYMTSALKKSGFTRRSFVRLLNVQQKLGMQDPNIRLKDDVYITNATKCRNQSVKPNGMFRNEPPENHHIDACRPWLEIQVSLIKPTMMMAMGQKSLYALKQTENVSMVKDCGPAATNTPQVDTEIGGKAWVVLHPSYWMRKAEEEHPAFIEKLDKDLMRVRDALRALTAPQVQEN